MKNSFYSLLYNPGINKFIRNINYFVLPILPKKIQINPSGVVTIKITKNKKIKLKTNQTSHITRELFYKGSHNYEYTPIFKPLIKKVTTFFDIGSSIGYYSILGASINPRLKVEAFEPSIGPMLYLCENVKINKLSSRIKVNALALSDKQGEIDFFEIKNKKYPTIYSLSGEHNIGTKPDLASFRTKVNSDTLDNFVIKNNIQEIELIKIDTEGCEDLILKGSSNIISKFKPIIICEILFNKIENRLEKIMKTYDYEFYIHRNNVLIKVTTIQRKIDDGVRNCFFVHPSKKHLIKEFVTQ